MLELLRAPCVRADRVGGEEGLHALGASRRDVAQGIQFLIARAELVWVKRPVSGDEEARVATMMNARVMKVEDQLNGCAAALRAEEVVRHGGGGGSETTTSARRRDNSPRSCKIIS